ELASRRAAIDAKLSQLAVDDADLRIMDQPLREAWGTIKHAAGRLTAERRKVAKEFAKAIARRFKPLGLGAAGLTVMVEPRELADDPSCIAPLDSGVDRVEIVFSANRGEEPRPLRKIASGGELSRVTLAAKTVLAAVDRVPTLVFDEIDAGVGGRLGSGPGEDPGGAGGRAPGICGAHPAPLSSC